MGLTPIQPGDWLREDGDYKTELAEKHHLMTQRPQDVFEARPTSAAVAEELLRTIADELTQAHPKMFQRNGDVITNTQTGDTWDISHTNPADVLEHPLVKAGRMVQEDLILMEKNPTSGKIEFTAGYVSFPSRWNFREKMGENIWGVHQPVPDLNAQAGISIEAMLERMLPTKPLWRINWSVHDLPDMHQLVSSNTCHKAQPTTITADNAGDTLWLRVERQTLRKLPISNAVVFALKTYVYPLKDLSQTVKERIAFKLGNLPAPVLAYKGISGIIKPLMDYLKPKQPTAIP